MKKILVLNGSTRAHGNTKKLIDGFTDGATEAGNVVHEIKTDELNFSGELHSNDQGVGENPYHLDDILKDDGDLGYLSREALDADIIVFATPVYWWTISGSLKTAMDYLQPIQQAVGYKNFVKKSLLLVTAGGNDFSQPVTWYRGFEKYLNWKNLGEVLGSEKTAEARKIGLSIK